MKQVVYGIVTALMVVLTLGIVMTVVGRMDRQSDMDNALSVAVEDAVESAMNQKTYTIFDNREFIADFTQGLLVQLSNDSDVEIYVARVDCDKGIMSIRVVENFTHPNGKRGKNQCSTTVVFEHVPTKAELVEITFMLDKEKVYKRYGLVKGNRIIVPRDPTLQDKKFEGWTVDGTDGVVNDFGLAEKDITYVAVFK